MPCADPGQPARNDLAALGDKALQQANVAVGDGIDLLRAELADLLAAEELASTRTAAQARLRDVGRAGRRTGVAGVGGTGACCSVGLRAVSFVSHDISLSITLCLPRSRPAVESLNILPIAIEMEAKFGDSDTLCECGQSLIANLFQAKAND